MTRVASDIAFTSSVKAVQTRLGSRDQYARTEQENEWSTTVTPELREFLAERDSFYLATASAEGRPYIQHRGGPKGLLQVMDEKTLAFADYAGNRQYISIGNLADNNQAFVFLMDYATQTRIKIWGRAEVVADDSALLARLVDFRYKAKAQRVIKFHVELWDVNCRQHIPPKYSEREFEELLRPLHNRVADLEAENAALKNQLVVR